MRPYLAIIVDSFSEALASRVLWVLLIAISLVLAAMAPLSYREQRTTEFARRDIINARRLIKAMRNESEQDKPTPAKRVWSLLDEPTQKELTEFEQDENLRGSAFYQRQQTLVDALNGLLDRKDLYDEESWANVLLDSETRALLKQGGDKLAAEDLARANRLLIEKSRDGCFRPLPPRQVVITYLGFSVSPALQFTVKQVQRFVEKLVIPAIMGLLVGSIAVFVAILVTAPIIPQMFDPGSLSLMLSKPVSRSLLFLAKFVGGCAFILINVAYLVAGLWLIAGTRFGIWNHRLLLCVPIFLFLFAVYYSVSAITGVIWRNAVVCVVMTVAFWLICFIVGTTKGVFEQLTVETRRLTGLVTVDESPLAVDERGATYRWDKEAKQWESVFLDSAHGPVGRVIGPVYDSKERMLLASQAWGRRMFRSGASLEYGKESDGWQRTEGPALPEGTFALLPDPKGRLLVATSSGMHRLVGSLDKTGKKVEFMWMEIPTSFGNPFRSAGPDPPLALEPPTEAAADLLTGDVAIYSHGRLLHLVRDDGKFTLGETADIDIEKESGAGVAIGGNTILLAVSDGRILVYDMATLNLRASYRPEEHSQPRFVQASPDGKWFAVVFHNGTLHLFDSTKGETGEMFPANVRGQKDISAVQFPNNEQMLVVDRVTRITGYETGTWNQVLEYAPALSALEMAYYYAIVPIYKVFPKPGELDNTMLYLLHGEETSDMGLSVNTGDLERKRPVLRPWAPVWSSLIFLIIILGLACFYIERQDF